VSVREGGEGGRVNRNDKKAKRARKDAERRSYRKVRVNFLYERYCAPTEPSAPLKSVAPTLDLPRPNIPFRPRSIVIPEGMAAAMTFDDELPKMVADVVRKVYESSDPKQMKASIGQLRKLGYNESADCMTREFYHVLPCGHDDCADDPDLAAACAEGAKAG
jgi:hypothetical protein